MKKLLFYAIIIISILTTCLSGKKNKILHVNRADSIMGDCMNNFHFMGTKINCDSINKKYVAIPYDSAHLRLNFANDLRKFVDISIQKDSIESAKQPKTENENTNNLNSSRSQNQSGNVKVVNSTWDGSVSQVKKYIKDNLNDPDSYKSVKWSVVYDDPNGYKVAHEYRAKNGFGAVISKQQIFYLDFNGKVTKVEE